MPLPLTTSKLIRGQRFGCRTELPGQPLRSVGIDFIVALWKSTVLFHKLELNCETESPFVGHAWQQFGLAGGECPQVLGVWIDPRIRHGKPCYELRRGTLWNIGNNFGW